MDEEGGRPRTVCGSFMDLREQKLLELSLVEALHKANEASKAKQQFLANMSHEIRTPMNAIIGMADLLWESPLSADQKEYVRVFRSSGETLLDLINDILDLAKVEEGRLDLEEVAFNLPDLWKGTVEVFVRPGPEEGLEMGVRIGPDVPSWVMGRPGSAPADSVQPPGQCREVHGGR
jgi:signal transduction histidine kinase